MDVFKNTFPYSIIAYLSVVKCRRLCLIQGWIQDFRKGGSFICRAAAEGSTQRCGVLISLRKARTNFLAFIFQLAIMMGSRGTFVLCTASKRIAGPVPTMTVIPFLAQISLMQRNTYDVDIGPTGSTYFRYRYRKC